MLNIVHLFGSGVGHPLMISEGLLDHPKINVSFNERVISLGKILAQPSNNIKKELLACDYIFLCSHPHFGDKDLLSFINHHKLWGKTAYYDYQDRPRINIEALDKCLAYFKRSWTEDSVRNPLPIQADNLYPLDFGVLNAYIEAAPKEQLERDIDVGCYFRHGNGKRRQQMLHTLLAADWGNLNTKIGYATAQNSIGRDSVFQPLEENLWADYIELLYRTKVVFTAFPEMWDGDMRTWEAMSSGALCFIDTTYIPSPNYFESGEHCFIYNADDKDSILNAIEIAKGHIDNYKEIGKRGQEHALRYHRGISRVNYMLERINAG